MLDKLSNVSAGVSNWFGEVRDRSDFIEWLKIAPYKKIMDNRGRYIELANDRGYLQLLEIQGKDILNLGHEEQQITLLNYHNWLIQFQYDLEIYSTKLPTDTTRQVRYLTSCLNRTKAKLKKTNNQRVRAQLQDQKQILEQNIKTELMIQKQIYNSEFILFLYGKTVRELDDLVAKAMSYGNQDFVPKVISRSKKEQILEQINNMSEKI
ncbi:hypothetical protein [Ligilactobacillus murinus]|uniref:Uncharacterized protein n=1 Tax=Ligilactobacillus murinus TaxID=1622 RepID=A0AAE7BR87_9LACO|nr:hypothetical protein [Ligilactobacillus murinus]NEF81859.1 hypothetical protein [Ligilactobacillus murinus]NEF83986.1 hypothetical protein [Ligilactobacillus murinus]NEF86429.1 hypothetical protein [Ligilactobacillus murinus]NEF88697.1 hypothetical protein [Ligilactobacillus murinus]NEF90965.1 hypothetical protein [Ligilactobacillus murinus]